MEPDEWLKASFGTPGAPHDDAQQNTEIEQQIRDVLDHPEADMSNSAESSVLYQVKAEAPDKK